MRIANDPGFSVIQMPRASDEESVTFRFGPIDCCFLSLTTSQFMVRVIFDYIVLDRGPLRPSFRTSYAFVTVSRMCGGRFRPVEETIAPLTLWDAVIIGLLAATFLG
jgi:hypothetical protein